VSVIYYNLNNATNLGQFVNAPNPLGGWLPAQNHIPAVAGIYVIGNFVAGQSNCYVGIGGNLNNRFATRHEAACHLGFNHATMSNIVVWYGTVQVFNTPVAPGPGVVVPAPPVLALTGGAGPVPAAQIGAAAAAVLGVQYLATIDGVAGINLEHLLVRHYLNGAGFLTNTNTNLVGQFQNTTGNAMNVYVNYAAVNAIPAGHSGRVMAGGAWL
jgi:hypothetical protein